MLAVDSTAAALEYRECEGVIVLETVCRRVVGTVRTGESWLGDHGKTRRNDRKGTRKEERIRERVYVDERPRGADSD